MHNFGFAFFTFFSLCALGPLVLCEASGSVEILSSRMNLSESKHLRDTENSVLPCDECLCAPVWFLWFLLLRDMQKPSRLGFPLFFVFRENTRRSFLK